MLLGSWVGGEAVLVQTGDLLDRGPDSIGLVAMFRRLQGEARGAGGDVVLLLGNHELMNRQHYYRDVNREEIVKLGLKTLNETKKSLRAVREGWKVWENMTEYGELGQHIVDLHALAIVGTGKCRTVFSHAGLLAHHVGENFTIDNFNAYAREVLTREVIAEREEDVLSPEDGPLWNRILSWGPEDVACEHVNHVLRALNASQMVVGHSVHPKISTRCEGRLQMIDVGISQAYGGRVAGWQCINNEVKAIYPGRSQVVSVTALEQEQ